MPTSSGFPSTPLDTVKIRLITGDDDSRTAVIPMPRPSTDDEEMLRAAICNHEGGDSVLAKATTPPTAAAQKVDCVEDACPDPAIGYTHPEALSRLALSRLLIDGAKERFALLFNKPHKISTEKEWVDWIPRLKSLAPHPYGLEFVQGWDGRKIVLLAAVPWTGSLMTAVL
ncbi:hypothetical protein DFP73DRAFT_632881 [Morchella snyderi]|nr:hypothetical protein DFP73DRAFT_632881 [Morchella snyderi]